MTILLLVAWCLAMMFSARLICRNWVNHLTLYTAAWTVSLCAYELHWIRYNSIGTEAWIYIFAAWIAIYLGTAFASVLGSGQVSLWPDYYGRRLKTMIVFLSFAGLASCFVLARQVMDEVNSNLLVAVTVGAPRIYAAVFEETGTLVGIPYIAFLPFAASALAGAYTAVIRRLDWVSVFPLLVATIGGVLSASRWNILFAAVLFLLSLFLTPKSKPVRLSNSQKALLFVACLSGILLITLTRTDLANSLTEQSGSLDKISELIPVAPSLYFYFSGPPVGFGEYLRDSRRESSSSWGRYTFASFYRFLSKFGLSTRVPFHQEFYSTPEPINTCTYLRELHSDFGVPGIFVFPFALGFVAGRIAALPRGVVRVILLAHIYVIVLFSYTSLIMSTGQWFQSAIVSTCAALFLSRSSASASGVRTLRGVRASGS